MAQLFEYAAILSGKKDEEDKLLIEPTWTLSESIAALNLRIARELPEDVMDKADRVQILVRPF